ncbi:hypothetical protein [Polymorphobacter fuscus]|uniref:hypothetical protein n=1 Tax=Sandarakinorhabdus fusca TaxID=1439888 RepID=UPI001430161C|nr:hypothetical protein [Polymorphobacter fuscus]NJC07215.1 hypothetical protein [Polymorphobacter fuscus]
MAVYLVTYDLSYETKRPPIVQFIKEHYDWARLSESSYAIETTLDAAAIYSIFSHFLDNNDRFYVIRLSAPIAGYGPVAVNEWLEMKLLKQPALPA